MPVSLSYAVVMLCCGSQVDAAQRILRDVFICCCQVNDRNAVSSSMASIALASDALTKAPGNQTR